MMIKSRDSINHRPKNNIQSVLFFDWDPKVKKLDNSFLASTAEASSDKFWFYSPLHNLNFIDSFYESIAFRYDILRLSFLFKGRLSINHLYLIPGSFNLFSTDPLNRYFLFFRFNDQTIRHLLSLCSFFVTKIEIFEERML